MDDQTYADVIRYQLQQLRVNEESPMARVPNTYLSRLWVLNDVPYQGRPAVLEHLKSNYLVFSSNFHGELDDYLKGMWRDVEDGDSGDPAVLRRLRRTGHERRRRSSSTSRSVR